MSLLEAYDFKKKSKQKKPKLEEADDLLAEIEKIAVSEEVAKMWMEDPCLPPDSIIETEDGPQRIADIQVGAKVLTHKGFHKVSKTYSREFNGELIALTPYYSNMRLLLTPSHPVLAIKTIKKCYYNKHFGICLPTCSVKNKICNEPYKQYKIEWIPAGQLEKGDAVAIGIVSEKKTSLYAFKLGGHLFVCLKKVERVPYSGLVYNLEVNPAETYVAEGIIVHNCGKPC